MDQVGNSDMERTQQPATENGAPGYYELLALQERARSRRTAEASGYEEDYEDDFEPAENRFAKFLGRFARRGAQVTDSPEPSQDGREETLLPERTPRTSVFALGVTAASGALKVSRERIEHARDRTRLYAGNSLEFFGRHQKKIVVGLGVVAVVGGLAAFDAESYTSHFFGLANIHDAANHGHDAVRHAHDVNTTVTNPAVEPSAVAGHANQTHTAVEHAKTAAQKQPHRQLIADKTQTEQYNFNATPGASITGEFKIYAAQHGKHLTPQKLFDIYVNIKHKLHGHIAHRQIALPNGEIGLPQGHDSLSPETVKLLKQYIG
jgi:hypothetical protein